MHQDSSIQDNDVLCGRGGATNNHVGNKRYRSLVSDHQNEYLLAKKKDKADIAREIVRLVRVRGGRFLRKGATGTNMWVEVGDKKATEKTSQALREGLDVRHKEFRGVKSKKAQRRDSDSTSEHPKKRRRTEGSVVSGRVMTPMMQGSPALVSEPGSPCVPGLQEEEKVNLPYFIYHPAKISETDCDHVETV
mmetsp:Transcript_30680/g.40207  ORF Transcript_30680/g.40207 Transcript_30680/m.40207 type:complete len:192 (-) Transcript_30680:148-723(-)